MIEVVLDIKEISTKDEFILYVSSKIGLPYEGLNGNWDAFTDDFREIQYKEFTDFKEYNGWTNYEQYLILKETNAEYGLKNSDGVRDDLKLIFINFLPFFMKHKDIAMVFLEIFAEVREEAKEFKKETDILLDIDICIKS